MRIQHRYDVSICSRVRGDTWLGWVDADSEEQAIELAEKAAHERDQAFRHDEYLGVNLLEGDEAVACNPNDEYC